jgi:hypothetical protein
MIVVFAFAAYVVLAGLWFNSIFVTDGVAGHTQAVQIASRS